MKIEVFSARGQAGKIALADGQRRQSRDARVTDEGYETVEVTYQRIGDEIHTEHLREGRDCDGPYWHEHHWTDRLDGARLERDETNERDERAEIHGY